MDNYSNAGGCGILHPFNREKRLACEAQKAQKTQAKQTDANASLLLSQAAILKAQQQEQEDKWTPLAVGGVVVASLLAIGMLVLIIKKAKSK